MYVVVGKNIDNVLVPLKETDDYSEALKFKYEQEKLGRVVYIFEEATGDYRSIIEMIENLKKEIEYLKSEINAIGSEKIKRRGRPKKIEG